MTDFVRFPRTPHLSVLGAFEVRDDKVLSPEAALRFLDQEVVVEEKIDGENLGLSVVEGRIAAQARGSYVEPGGAHFRGLASWLAPRASRIAKELGESLILFGEWCVVRHSVPYDRLPDWFVVFDVYDRCSGEFWPLNARDLMAASLGFAVVPLLDAGRRGQAELEALLGESKFSHVPMEGVVIRHPRSPNDRAKLVRPGFVAEMEGHWRSKQIELNRLGSTSAA